MQTNPPDRVFGAPPARQATILNETEAMLWRAPRVRSWAQYLWLDEPRRSSFQSGLRFRDGRAKPALAAYRLPIDARRVSWERVRVWLRLPPGAASALLSDGTVLRGEGVVTATIRTRAKRISARAGGFSSRAARVRPE